jgi:hypothetical protein
MLLLLFASALVAQQPARSLKSETSKVTEGAPSNDSALAADAIRDSYYHPDKLAGIDCAVSVDWPSFFNALKATPATDRLQALQGLKVKAQATRDKNPEVTFDWVGGPIDNKQQLEDGLKQMLGGFYQLYWSMVASPPIASSAEISKVEHLQDGGIKIYSSSQNTNIVIITDKDRIPNHYTLKSPAINAEVDVHYIASPKPVPGDPRRISGIDESIQMGTSTINVNVNLDYQAVEGFYIPEHVSYDLVGAYSISMDFSGCSVSKTVSQAAVK